MAEPAFCSAPVPEAMAVKGWGWPKLIDVARRCVDLLQAVGDVAVDGVIDCLEAWTALSERDFSTLFAEIASAQKNWQKVVEAIQKEFGLE